MALEIDSGLVRWLADQDLGRDVEVRHEDALRADLGGLVRELGPPVVLLGNLPYRISGRLLGGMGKFTTKIFTKHIVKRVTRVHILYTDVRYRAYL